MSVLAKLGVWLTVNTSEFKAGLDDATKSTKAFESNVKKSLKEAERASQELNAMMSKIGIVATVASAGILKLLQHADQIADMADAFEISINSLMEMQRAFTLAGGKADALGNAMSKLAQNAQRAREGSDEARKGFEKLGISGAEVDKLAPDELFARVAESLNEIENPTQRSAVAFENLGKAAKGVDWKKYWQEYGEGKDTLQNVSGAVKDAAQAWENLEKAGKSALNVLLTMLRPISALINNIADTIRRIQSGEGGDVDWGAAMGGLPNEGVISYGDSPKSKKAPVETKKLQGGYSKPSEASQAEASAAEMVRRQTQDYVRLVGQALRRQQVETENARLTRNERDVRVALLRIEEERNTQLSNLNRELAVEQSKGEKANKERIDALKEQMTVVLEVKNAELKATEEIMRARQEEQRSFEFGWNRAFAQFAEDAGNKAKVAEDMFKSFTDNMLSALDRFVESGKLSFSDLARSIILDLIKIQLRAQAVGIFGSLSKVFSFGSMGASSSTDFLGASAGSSGGFGLKFATGGVPPVGVPSLVGENGPELFVPRSSGAVIPNNQLGNVLGGSNVNYYGPYIANMSAIDTQSFTQALAKNKMAVWSANQSASRAMPTSR